MTVNTHEAKTQLSKLLRRVESGEEVIICRAGKPVAKLTPYAPVGQPRQLGLWRGKVKIAEDFDELPEDLLKAFYEGPLEPPA